MKVLMVEPYKAPYVREIYGGEFEIRSAVGGYTETAHSFDDAVIICNRDAYNGGLGFNRGIADGSGKIVKIIAGIFMICGLKDGKTVSLTPELINKYYDMFHDPEIFYRIDGVIKAKKVPESVFVKNKERREHER